MPHSPIGESHEDVVREEIERDPAFATAYEETQIEAQAALALAEMREQRQLTQQALAQAAGTSQPMINRIEKAGQIPTITTMWKLMRALDGETVIRADGITIRPALPLPSSFLTANVVPINIVGQENAQLRRYILGWAPEWPNPLSTRNYSFSSYPSLSYSPESGQVEPPNPHVTVGTNVWRLFPMSPNGEATVPRQGESIPISRHQREWGDIDTVAVGR
jgi:transcriptional regulator with XRE-family HTH domain